MVAVTTQYRPMLASNGAIHGDEGDYAFEPKWDGWRASWPTRAGRRWRSGRGRAPT